MADLLIRNVPEAVVARLKEQARANSRSLQGELSAVLESAARPTWADWCRRADAVREHSRGRVVASDSTALVREDRDSR